MCRLRVFSSNCSFFFYKAVLLLSCDLWGGGGGRVGRRILYILKVAASVDVRVIPLWAAADSLLAYTWPNKSLIGWRGCSCQWVRAELSLDWAKLTKNKRSSEASDSCPFQRSWMTLIHNCLLYFLLIIPQPPDDQHSIYFQAWLTYRVIFNICPSWSDSFPTCSPHNIYCRVI